MPVPLVYDSWQRHRRTLRKKSLGCGCECACADCVSLPPLAALERRGKRATPGFSYKARAGYALDAGEGAGDTTFDDGYMAISYPFAASQGRDRVGDFLEVGPTQEGQGIITTNHERLPVAYLEHGEFFPYPIGLDRPLGDAPGEYTVKILPERGLAVCKTYLSQHLQEAEQTYHLYREGLLRGGSIAYRPILTKRLPADPGRGFEGGLYLPEVELLETTLTGMPCNPDAIRKVLEVGCCGKTLAPSLKSMLSARAAPAPVWSRGWTTPGGDGSKSAAAPAMSAVDQASGGALVGPTPPGRGRPRRRLKLRRNKETVVATPASKKDYQAPAPAPVVPDEADRVPHGAQVLGDLYAVVEMARVLIAEELPVIDSAAVRDFLEKEGTALEESCGRIAEAFGKQYPDLEPLEVDLSPTDPDGGKRFQHRKLGKKAGKKRMNKSETETVRDAAEFLDEHAGHPALDRKEKAAVRYHAKALGDLAARNDDPAGDDLTPEEKSLADAMTKAGEQIKANRKLLVDAGLIRE